MKNITIRPATAADIPLLKPLGIELQDNEKSLNSFRAKGVDIVDQYNEILLRDFLAGEWQVFVAEVEGKIVGYISGTSNDPEDDLENTGRGYHIGDVVVSKIHRGLGIGKKLLGVVFEYAKEKGYISVELNVLTTNTAAQRFYTNQGFEDYELVLRKSF